LLENKQSLSEKKKEVPQNLIHISMLRSNSCLVMCFCSKKYTHRTILQTALYVYKVFFLKYGIIA